MGIFWCNMKVTSHETFIYRKLPNLEREREKGGGGRRNGGGGGGGGMYSFIFHIWEDSNYTVDTYDCLVGVGQHCA